MWTPRNLKLSTFSTTALSMRMGASSVLLFSLSTIISFVLITLRERLLSWRQVSDLLPIDCLVVVSDQAYHCCVISKLNDGVGVVPDQS
jgi:hypothetical protein